jgi:deoxycytidylate deaminase
MLLRKVYGPQFILVSAYAPKIKRLNQLEKSMKSRLPTTASAAEVSGKVALLIERDENESHDIYGQNLRGAFHLADVFVDGIDKRRMSATLERFFGFLFGRTDSSPSKDEYGMYTAKSASLRSADLSRQVGAALFTEDGDLICEGCNEVPKAHGGTYWDSEEPDNRDIKKGFDPNDRIKRDVLRNAIELLRKDGYLSKKATDIGTDEEICSFLTSKHKDAILSDSLAMDLTEYGRVVHAEMCAVCNSARLGRSLKGSVLYCTTFPCHNCTKHLIAVGVRKVVFMEPYPKSRAAELHPDEIEIETDSDPNKISFVPFLGISPYRYRNIFQKGRRKATDGSANSWISGSPKPVFDIKFPSYPDKEEPWALRILLGNIKEVEPKPA